MVNEICEGSSRRQVERHRIEAGKLLQIDEGGVDRCHQRIGKRDGAAGGNAVLTWSINDDEACGVAEPDDLLA